MFVQEALSKRDWSSVFLKYTQELIKNKSVDHIGGTSHKYMDVVKDVVNLLPVYWVSRDIVSVGLLFMVCELPFLNVAS